MSRFCFLLALPIVLMTLVGATPAQAQTKPAEPMVDKAALATPP